MPWMTITCGKCGGSADIDEFIRTPVFGELPRNVFQCPKCQYAFERRCGKPTVYTSGWVKPGPVTLVPIGAVL